MRRRCVLLLVFACLLRAGSPASVRSAGRKSSPSSEPQEISFLPGFDGPMPSKHLSGYINVDAEHGRHLFYWVVHSEGSLQHDPVVLWLTGGPGCSSLDALIYEHGPFTFRLTDRDQRVVLEENPHSWSKSATMIYVDSPAGAGLSYSDTPADYSTNDTRTIDDLYTFLQQLLAVMPELSHQEFYLAGESYGGVYVPLLARKILDMNEEADVAAHSGRGSSSSSSKLHPARINLKGYMIGNGVTDDAFEGDGQWEFAYGMGLIDPPVYAELQAACNGSFWNAAEGSTCMQQLKRAREIFYWVNPYDILAACFIKPKQEAEQEPVPRTSAGAGRRPGVAASSLRSDAAATAQGRAGSSGLRQGVERSLLAASGFGAAEAGAVHPHRLWAHRAARRLGHTVACGDRRAALLWLSNEDTRVAIHAASAEAVPWQPCSDILNYSVPFPISLINLHKDLVTEGGLRALLYSGDHDFIVPFTATRNWIYSMQLQEERRYAAWTINQQVAGFVASFRPNLMFATIKGAGHMAPQTNPKESAELIDRFLKKEL